jgi:hypothetical protein
MGTQTATLVSTICQWISDLRGESTADTSAGRIRAVSRAEQDFANRYFWRCYLVKNQTVAGTGVSDYTIGSATYPMRQKGLAEVFAGGTTEDKRYQVVDFNEYMRAYNSNNSARIAYEWYDEANDLWKVHINYTGTGTITYSHFWLPPVRTLATEKVICPNARIIVLLGLADIYEGEDSKEDALAKKQEAEQLINELKGQETTPAVNQLYGMSAIENAVRNRGIGSY